MTEEEKEKAQKAKRILASKELEQLLKESQEALSKTTTSIQQELPSEKPEETRETLEQLKRKRKRLEKAL